MENTWFLRARVEICVAVAFWNQKLRDVLDFCCWRIENLMVVAFLIPNCKNAFRFCALKIQILVFVPALFFSWGIVPMLFLVFSWIPWIS